MICVRIQSNSSFKLAFLLFNSNNFLIYRDYIYTHLTSAKQIFIFPIVRPNFVRREIWPEIVFVGGYHPIHLSNNSKYEIGSLAGYKYLLIHADASWPKCQFDEYHWDVFVWKIRYAISHGIDLL